MAPFKLKFRMGGSRSTSQEHEPDPQVNEALLNHQTVGGMGASSSTIDSVDCNSLVSLNTSERKLLLPNKSNTLKMGFMNQNQAKQGESIPSTPPPSYECVLEEQRQLANGTAAATAVTTAATINDDQLNTCLEQVSLTELPCTDPNCREIFNIKNNNETTHTNPLRQTQEHTQQHKDLNNDPNDSNQLDNTENQLNVTNEDDRKESIDSQEFLLGENMTDSSSEHDREQQQQQQQQLEHSCSGSCQEYAPDGQECSKDCQQYNADGTASCSGIKGERNNGNDFYDPLMNHNVYCNDASHYDEDYQNQMCNHDGVAGNCSNECTNECTSECGNECSNEHHWGDHQQSSSQHNMQYDNRADQQQQQYYQQPEYSQASDAINYKSSKELYKDLAKEWGITCKMSDGCRCMECQSNYFDCEFDDNEQQQTDGGLGAGTPMFITEVMHGSACNIL